VIERLVAATEPEDVVIGGGNLVHLKKLPKGCRAGNNAYAFIGEFRMWDSGSGPNNRGREKTKRLVRRIGARRLESLTCRNHSENCGPRTNHDGHSCSIGSDRWFHS
jgi:hypothetical protein